MRRKKPAAAKPRQKARVKSSGRRAVVKARVGKARAAMARKVRGFRAGLAAARATVAGESNPQGGTAR